MDSVFSFTEVAVPSNHMQFGPVGLDEAAGHILGHNITGPDGRRAFRKGKPLTQADVEELRSLGLQKVYVARLETGDVSENEAAERIAAAGTGSLLRLSGPATGRVNIFATERGLFRVNPARLQALNGCEGVTLATLPPNTPVLAGKMVATLKILPYAIPEMVVMEAEEIAGGEAPLCCVDALPERRVALILSGSPRAQERTVRTFQTALQNRLEALGSGIDSVDYVPLEDQPGEVALADTIRRRLAEGAELVILAGETAIMDPYDIAPRAVREAGGQVVCYGAPVDPGNLLMLAYLNQIAILGAPGCMRSPKQNIVDLVLPRLLAGDRLDRQEIISWGAGGLMEDVPERPAPRSRVA